MADIEYQITNVEERAHGLHVEFEYILNGINVHEEINYGPDMIAGDAWKPHLEEYLRKKMAFSEKQKARPDEEKRRFDRFKGTHKLGKKDINMP
ncbi:MAG: hypothetical protein WC350_05485 [Candidatus Micrarchaeia archaeon]|jgi:hypothetical protein